MANDRFGHAKGFAIMDIGHLPRAHRDKLRDYVPPPPGQRPSIEGYCTPLSASPGETIDFRVSLSSQGRFDVTYLRMSDLVDVSQQLPGRWEALLPPTTYHGSLQPLPPRAWARGCNWPSSFSLTVPDWPSGMYAAACRRVEDGSAFYIVFIVRPKAGARSLYAALANTNTWNAYNDWWGGCSRYNNDVMITEASFERPNPLTSPFAPYSYIYPSHLTLAECWILKWLAAEGYSVDVYSDQDFHAGIPDFAAYRALILSTHPEYWTAEMYENLKAYLEAGGNLLYLGGNGIFEEVTYEDGGSTLIFKQNRTDLTRDHFYFRNRGRPERGILGVAFKYDNYWSASAPYVIQPDGEGHPFLAGTGLRRGDTVGHYGLCGAASGREMDSSIEGTAAGFPVSARVNNDCGAPPKGVLVLAKGANLRSIPRLSDQLDDAHSAELTFCRPMGKGFVLAAGSFLFGGSLVLDSRLQQIVKNALRATMTIVPPGGFRRAGLAHIPPLLLGGE